MRYTIERPRTPITVWLLAAVIAVGLIALGIAAHSAFSLVADPLQAFFSAALIEVSAIVEAIALVRRRNRIAIVGLVISLLVSGTYNYIQAETAGRASGITNFWQLITLAIGPLSALSFLAMTLGKEIAAHEAQVAAWQADRQSFYENQEQERKAAEERDRLAQQQREEQERQFQLQLERERLEREQQTAIAQERLRLETEQKVKLAELRARKDAESTRQVSAPSPETAGKLPQVPGNSPIDWRKLSEEDRHAIAGMRTDEIVARWGVNDRTARNWASNAKKNGKTVEAL